MVEQNLGVEELSTSKERLRDALTRLEVVVNERTEAEKVQAQQGGAEFTDEIAKLRADLNTKSQELENVHQNMQSGGEEATYLRDENRKLQSEIGQTLEESKQIKKLNKRAVVRVDSLVAELKAVLLEQGA